LREELMLALYRSGRQAEALEAYRSARAYLVEECGLEPSKQLQTLHRACSTRPRNSISIPLSALPSSRP
jgi:DNA-binding SARP family transcriptional activator